MSVTRNIPVEVEEITWYNSDDVKFYGDYTGVTLNITWENGQKDQLAFGDYYHEKGDIRTDAMIHAFTMVNPNLKVTKRNFNEDY